MGKQKKDVLTIIQDRCNSSIFDGFSEMYPDQQWKIIVQELSRKGIVVIPDYKEQLSTLQEEVGNLQKKYLQAIYFLRSLLEHHTGAKKIKEKSLHKLFESIHNLITITLGSKRW